MNLSVVNYQLSFNILDEKSNGKVIHAGEDIYEELNTVTKVFPQRTLCCLGLD